MEKNTNLELVLVTGENISNNDPCGPDTCPWVECGLPSN